MELIEFNGKKYPKFQASGFAARFAWPYALGVLLERGYKHGFDIGCGRKEWALHGSIPIDVNFHDGFDAFRLPTEDLPNRQADYIFSSHCLEHLDRWVDVLDYWTQTLRPGGVLFLYLPHYDQEYWRPWNNRKHKNIFTPEIIEDYLKHAGYINIFKSGVDLNSSFMIYAERGNN